MRVETFIRDGCRYTIHIREGDDDSDFERWDRERRGGVHDGGACGWDENSVCSGTFDGSTFGGSLGPSTFDGTFGGHGGRYDTWHPDCPVHGMDDGSTYDVTSDIGTYGGTSDGDTSGGITSGGHSGSRGDQGPDRSSEPAENNPRIRKIITNNGATPPAEAAYKLQKIATVMNPIMEEHDLRLESLAELKPSEEPGLHGYNTADPPHRIYLNLRHGPWYMVLDTMLHELAHNVHGPHDRHFYKLWNTMRASYSRLRGPEWEGSENARRRLHSDDMPPLARRTPSILCRRPSGTAPVVAGPPAPPRHGTTATRHDKCPNCRKERYRCRCRVIYC